MILIYCLLVASVVFNVWLMFSIDKRIKRRKKSAENYQKFINALNEEELFMCYEDSFGNKWYTWANPASIPPERALMAEIAANAFEMNISRDDLVLYIQQIINHCNNGKLTKVAAIAENIAERLEYAADEKTLISLAKCYFILEGENLRSPSIADSNKKDDIWNKDSECRDFFLRSAFKHTALYSAMSETDILTYLKDLTARRLKTSN